MGTLLMLLMITPSMVCVMTLCQHKAEAAMPCHGMEMGDHHKTASPKAVPPLLAGDCLKNDLGQASPLFAPLPQDSFIFIALSLPLLFFAVRRQMSLNRAGTGPPPRRRPSFARILITMRILQ